MRLFSTTFMRWAWQLLAFGTMFSLNVVKICSNQATCSSLRAPCNPTPSDERYASYEDGVDVVQKNTRNCLMNEEGK
jgi:hypothetical protein